MAMAISYKWRFLWDKQNLTNILYVLITCMLGTVKKWENPT